MLKLSADQHYKLRLHKWKCTIILQMIFSNNKTKYATHAVNAGGILMKPNVINLDMCKSRM